jgi:hypothetical protein
LVRRPPRLKLLAAALAANIAAVVVVATAVVVATVIIIAASPSPSTTAVRSTPVLPRRRNSARPRRRSARRRGRLAKDLGPGLVVAPLLLLAVSLLLCADFVRRHLHYRRPGGVVVVIERQLGQAGDGVFLGDGGLAAEDFDLRFERRGEGDAAAGSFDVVEYLFLFRIAVLPAKSKKEDCQPTENIKSSIKSFLHTLIPIVSGLLRRAAAAAAVVC